MLRFACGFIFAAYVLTATAQHAIVTTINEAAWRLQSAIEEALPQ